MQYKQYEWPQKQEVINGHSTYIFWQNKINLGVFSNEKNQEIFSIWNQKIVKKVLCFCFNIIQPTQDKNERLRFSKMKPCSFGPDIITVSIFENLNFGTFVDLVQCLFFVLQIWQNRFRFFINLLSSFWGIQYCMKHFFLNCDKILLFFQSQYLTYVSVYNTYIRIFILEWK